MKAMTRLFTGLALVGALGATTAWADQPGADWKVTKDQAEATLKGAGYTQNEFQVDPHKGKVIKDEQDN